ncbi:RdgB/HAM1 family non-canonical purine NTP pyrophosphatase [Dehalococcoidia bacterium]|nr:RdgB/HAM1 family non-canonical purine NTP pyrophosphatase [Dehalococcoidia bacterium]
MSESDQIKKIVLATHNEGKQREIKSRLSKYNLEVLSLGDVGITNQIEETGTSFRENALIKARGYYELCGELTLAEDSGLEVDALFGRPGVGSARYGEIGFNDQDRLLLLLEEMRNIPGWNRGARFISCMSLVGLPQEPSGIVCRGIIEGFITHQPIGLNGFGYDPIFWVALECNTMANLSIQDKNRISHRGKALKQVCAHLEKLASSK